MSVLNISNQGEYPLVNENLKILAEDYKATIRMLDALIFPAKTCVVIELAYAGNIANVLMYVDGKMVKLSHDTTNGLVPGMADFMLPTTNYEVIVTSQNVDITNSMGFFANAYTIYTATLVSTTAANRYNFLMLQDALTSKVLPEIEVNIQDCVVRRFDNISLDGNGLIANFNSGSLVTNAFTGPNNSFDLSLNVIKRIGKFVKIRIYLNTAASPPYKYVIQLPTLLGIPLHGIVFNMATPIKAIRHTSLYDDFIFTYDYFIHAVFYKHYIIAEGNNGVTNINDLLIL